MGKVHNAMLKRNSETDNNFPTKENFKKTDNKFFRFPFTSQRNSQKRIHPRAETDWPVTIIKNEAPLYGKVRNISKGGALVYFQDTIPVGEKIKIAIEIEDLSDVITADAEVVRFYPVITGMSRSTYGVGIKYLNISNECLKFFSGNLANAWDNENYYNYPAIKPNVINTNSARTIIILVLLALIAFMHTNSNKIEKQQIKKIESLENDIARTKALTNDLNSKLETLLQQYNNLFDKNKTTAQYFSALFPFNLNSFSKYHNIDYIKSVTPQGEINSSINSLNKSSLNRQIITTEPIKTYNSYDKYQNLPD